MKDLESRIQSIEKRLDHIESIIVKFEKYERVLNLFVDQGDNLGVAYLRVLENFVDRIEKIEKNKTRRSKSKS